MTKVRQKSEKRAASLIPEAALFLNRLLFLADEGAHLLLKLWRNVGDAMFLSAMFRGGSHDFIRGVAARNEVTIDSGVSTADRFHVAPPCLMGNYVQGSKFNR